MKEFDRILGQLESNQEFSHTRLCHGFWEAYLRIYAVTHGILDSKQIKDPAAADVQARTSPCFLETGFLNELLDLFATLPDLSKSFTFAASPEAWPRSREIEGTPNAEFKRVMAIINQYIPSEFRSDGLVWKQATISGEIVDFYALLRNRRVVIVGPPRIKYLGLFLQLEHYSYIPIALHGARYQRYEIEQQIIDNHPVTSEAPVVYLMQAGNLATWLTFRLHPVLKNAVLLDVGGGLNICSIDTVLTQQWSQVYRTEVAKTIQSVSPDWYLREEAFKGQTTSETRYNLWLELVAGIDARITEILHKPELQQILALHVSTTPAKNKITFVEHKPPQWTRIKQLLATSENSNHWANRGPVSTALEKAVAITLELPEQRSVIMCSSGTAALLALVGAYNYRAGRRLRWVISAYGFPCTTLGVLHDSLIIDCDEQGFIDLEMLRTLDLSSYDGVLATNTFGLHNNWNKLIDFCKVHEKHLLYDNALALVGCNRGLSGAPDEIISFHHTKPWGAGEGGCAIVPKELEASVRAMINFAKGLNVSARQYAFNGKPSELACASILARLELRPSWSILYRMQQRRISNLASQVGFLPLAPLNNTPRGSVPLVAEMPFGLNGKASIIPVERYYHPLTNNAPNASAIFQRLVNIPCHPDMAIFSDHEIISSLEKITTTPCNSPEVSNTFDAQPSIKTVSKKTTHLPKNSQQLMRGEMHFIGIGAQKSGTTWAWSVLKEHPDIFTPENKELNFFYSEQPEQVYQKLFANTPLGKITGEVSPNYFPRAVVPARIHQLVPNAKLFCILRDPVHRAYSQWKMAQRLGNISKTISFIDAFRSNQRLMADSGNYVELIEQFTEFFPLDKQLKVFFFDDILHQPQTVARCLFEYIGVRRDFIPTALNINPNPTSDPQSISPADQEEVRLYYQESIEKLEQLMGRELPDWKISSEYA